MQKPTYHAVPILVNVNGIFQLPSQNLRYIIACFIAFDASCVTTNGIRRLETPERSAVQYGHMFGKTERNDLTSSVNACTYEFPIPCPISTTKSVGFKCMYCVIIFWKANGVAEYVMFKKA